MALSEAEKRRRRFVKEKNKYDDLNDLIKTNIEADVNVYFNENGDILQIGNIKRKKSKSEKMIVMKREQTDILNGKNWNLYKIAQDPIVDTVFRIELRPTEDLFVKSDEEFLQKIEFDNSKSYDVSISIEEYSIIISLSKKAKKIFAKQDPQNVSIKGSKVLKFYFTAENDPHYMIHGINVFLKDLISQEKVSVKVPLDLIQCDVYTYKLFDKYVRK